MAFRIQDFKCEDCEHVTEILLDSNDLDEKLICEKCKSEKLKPILGLGTGNKQHISWSKWRTPV